MGSTKKVIRWLIALVLLAIFVVAVIFALSGLWSLLGEVDPNVTAAIVAALAAVAGGIYTQRQLRIRQIVESHRAQKVELYDVYMDIIDLILDLAKGNQLDDITEESLPEDLAELYKKFRRGLVVWASPGVIRAYARFRVLAEGGGKGVLRGADAVFSEIRKDLGNSNWGLQEGDLMKLFLKDPDEYDALQ